MFIVGRGRHVPSHMCRDRRTTVRPNPLLDLQGVNIGCQA